MNKLKSVTIGLIFLLASHKATGQVQKYNLEGEWILQEWESSFKDLSKVLIEKVKMQELNATYFFRNNGKFYCQPRNNNMLEGSWNVFSNSLALYFEKGDRIGKRDTLILKMLKDERLQMVKNFAESEDYIRYTLIKTNKISEDKTYWRVTDVPPTFKGGNDSLLMLLDNSMEKALGSGYDTLYNPYGIELSIDRKGEVTEVDFVMLDSVAINKMVIKEVGKVMSKSKWNAAKVMDSSVNVKYKLIMEPKLSNQNEFFQSVQEVSVSSKATEVILDSSDNKIYGDYENPAYYKYGEDSLYTIVSLYFNMPDSAIENEVSGIVFIQFVIEKDGTLSNFEALTPPGKKKLGFGIEEECIRILKKSSGDWLAAKKGGKPVRSYFRFPFEVDNSGF